jgi:hypothetical protein
VRSVDARLVMDGFTRTMIACAVLMVLTWLLAPVVLWWLTGW